MSVSQSSGLDGLVPNAAPGERTTGLGATVLSVAARTVRKYMRTPELVVFAFMGSAASGRCRCPASDSRSAGCSATPSSSP